MLQSIPLGGNLGLLRYWRLRVNAAHASFPTESIFTGGRKAGRWVKQSIKPPRFPVLDYIITFLIFALLFSALGIVNIFRVLINISLEHFCFPLKHVFRVDCHIPG